MITSAIAASIQMMYGSTCPRAFCLCRNHTFFEPRVHVTGDGFPAGLEHQRMRDALEKMRLHAMKSRRLLDHRRGEERVVGAGGHHRGYADAVAHPEMLRPREL